MLEISASCGLKPHELADITIKELFEYAKHTNKAIQLTELAEWQRTQALASAALSAGSKGAKKVMQNISNIVKKKQGILGLNSVHKSKLSKSDEELMLRHSMHTAKKLSRNYEQRI